MSIERDGTMTLIREAAPRDAASIARVHVESWRNSYAGIIPDKVLLRLTVAEHEARWWRHALYRSRNHFVYVVDHPDDGVVGFGSGGGIRDRGLPFKGEVYTLYLLDDYHGRGIGKRLFQALAQRLVVEFGPTLIVWALEDNPSRFFYQALGGRLSARKQTVLGGTKLGEVAYGWDDARTALELGSSGEVR